MRLGTDDVNNVSLTADHVRGDTGTCRRPETKVLVQGSRQEKTEILTTDGLLHTFSLTLPKCVTE